MSVTMDKNSTILFSMLAASIALSGVVGSATTSETVELDCLQ